MFSSPYWSAIPVLYWNLRVSVHRVYQKVPERVRDPCVLNRNAFLWCPVRDSVPCRNAVSVLRIGWYMSGRPRLGGCGLYSSGTGIPILGHSTLECTALVGFCRGRAIKALNLHR